MDVRDNVQLNLCFRWVVRRERGQELDSAWLSLLYLLLGEHLGEQAQAMPLRTNRHRHGMFFIGNIIERLIGHR